MAEFYCHSRSIAFYCHSERSEENLLGMPGAEPFHARSLGPLEGTRALRDDAFQKMCWRNNVQKKCLA